MYETSVNDTSVILSSQDTIAQKCQNLKVKTFI